MFELHFELPRMKPDNDETVLLNTTLNICCQEIRLFRGKKHESQVDYSGLFAILHCDMLVHEEGRVGSIKLV